MAKLGFERLGADFSVFWRKEDDVILAIYTDDVVATGPDNAVVDHVMAQIRSEGLEFTVSENFKDVLGVVIDTADDGSISMSQAHYIHQMLDRFELTDIDPKRKAKAAYAKAEPKATLDATTKPFRALLGCLLWISGVTRPDISWAVGRMARESTAPTDRSWARLVGIAAYLKNTADRKLTFRAGDAPGWDRLIVFCDSDWAGDPSYRSTTGAITFYNGAPIASAIASNLCATQ